PSFWPPSRSMPRGPVDPLGRPRCPPAMSRTVFRNVAHGFSPAFASRYVLGVLAFELILFTVVAPNFLTAANFFEVTRLSVEVGILAIAMTPIIVTGGIDLSVGAMMGLAAVLFGAAYRDWNVPIVGAAAVALVAGGAGGALNAVLISRLNIPPLVVTLGSLSLF